jgi:hypothetical protein
MGDLLQSHIMAEVTRWRMLLVSFMSYKVASLFRHASVPDIKHIDADTR